MASHGTTAAYRSGCRCEECRSAMALRHREQVARHKTLLPVTRSRLDHGSVSTYTNHRCRCIHCTVAWRDYCAERRAKRVPPPPGDERHGRPWTYGNYGCRCDLCSAAKATYDRARKARQVTS